MEHILKKTTTVLLLNGQLQEIFLATCHFTVQQTHPMFSHKHMSTMHFTACITQQLHFILHIIVYCSTIQFFYNLCLILRICYVSGLSVMLLHYNMLGYAVCCWYCNLCYVLSNDRVIKMWGDNLKQTCPINWFHIGVEMKWNWKKKILLQIPYKNELGLIPFCGYLHCGTFLNFRSWEYFIKLNKATTELIFFFTTMTR